jgi:hypothetical protein
MANENKSSVSEPHIEFGRRLARRFFAKRGKGTNVEVHLSEAELAALLAIAHEAGAKECGTKSV